MFNLPNLSAKNRLLAGASFATLLIAAPAQATTLGGMTGRTSAQIAGTAVPRSAGFGGVTTPDQAKQATSQSSADFSTALARIQAQMSAQATARNAAIAGPNNLGADPNHPGQQLPDVPNGLGTGGLAPSANVTVDPSLWQNADAPTQATSGANTTVTVHQNAQKAILTWDSFNVGKNTTVHFDQTKGTAADGSNNWIALNRINDPSDRPSQILGNITAEGSVYLINKNGIIFGGSSQVNVHSLLVSSLDLFDGDLGKSNSFFLKYGIGQTEDPENILGAPNVNGFLVDGTATDSSGNVTPRGGIVVEAGSSISAGTQGYAMLVAPDINQGGSIVADSGQVFLASADLVRFVTPSVGQGSFTLDSPTAAPGTITNTGLIQTRSGSIQWIGNNIDQNGIVVASTSLSHPGSIKFGAAPGPIPVISLGSDSLTTILPEKDGETTTTSAAADAAFRSGSIIIQGAATVNGGAIIEAPSASVAFQSTTYVDHGAVIDVSGLADVELPMSSLLVTIPRIGLNELADSPLLRNSFLFAQKNVVVDSTQSGTRADGLDWVGSPIINAGGYVDNVPRTIDQLMISAGSISFEDSTVVRTGAQLRLDGGYTNYLPGNITTPRLQGANGLIYDIASADPNVTYVGFAGQDIVAHTRWAINDSYSNSLIASSSRWDPGFINGGDAGSLSLSPSASSNSFGGLIVLDGDVSAHALSGRDQVRDGQAPKGGSLSLQAQNLTTSDLNLLPPGINYVIQEQNIPLEALDPDFDATTVWPTSKSDPTDPNNPFFYRTLSTDMIDKAGFQNVALNTGGKILVKDGTTLAVTPGGSIDLTAVNLDVEGTLRAPSGNINLTTVALAFGFTTSPTDLHSKLEVGSHGRIDASGLWVNDTGLEGDDITGRQFINGGSVSMIALEGGMRSPNDLTGDIALDAGSVVDVSSGGYIGYDGKLAMDGSLPAGRGGDIAIETHVQDPGRQSSYRLSGAPTVLDGGNIILDGTLLDYGFSGGGSLTLHAPQIQVGGDPAPNENISLLYLDPSFFENKGFSSYSLISDTDALIAANTTIDIHPLYRVANLASLPTVPTGIDLDTARSTSIGDVTAYQRYQSLGDTAGFSLAAGGYKLWSPFGVSQTYNEVSGSLTVGENASINVEPGASVTLSAPTHLTILGGIRAPGGNIALTNNTGVASFAPGPGESLWLGDTAVLDVSGVSLRDPNANIIQAAGSSSTIQRTGVVLDGGTISLSSDGSVVAQQGALISVSGASDTFDLPAAVRQFHIENSSYQPTAVWSDAGSIKIDAGIGLFFDGTFEAQAGNPAGRGGSLEIDARRPDYGFSPSPTAIILQQSGVLLPADTTPGADVDPDRGTPDHVLRFAVDRLNGSGIDSLQIGPAQSANGEATNDVAVPLLFSGDVNIDLARSFSVVGGTIGLLPSGSLSLPADRVTGAGHVTVSAPYVSLAGTAGTATSVQGDGTLSVNSDFIDIGGTMVLAGIGDANFASSGDIRFTYPDFYVAGNPVPGWLYSTGNLDFAATRLYPATNYSFLIDANGGSDTNGNPRETTISFHGNGQNDESTPLSAGGNLVVAGSHIEQGGTIWAPSGSLVLGIDDPNSILGQLGLGSAVVLPQTESVHLLPGSVTSVSLNGAVLPYGTTVDGKDWDYNGDPERDSAALQAPPSKQIALNGEEVALDANATIDLSGGGHLQASEWVPGTGGSRDVLAQSSLSFADSASGTQIPLYADSRKIYAILPGYSAPISAHDMALEKGAGDGPAVGQGAYLSGIAGLPDGTYTLLPARYATMPGAYRVVQDTSVQDPIAGRDTVMPDGSNVVGGYFVDTLTGARNARTSLFQVQSAASWGQYSEYDLTSADTFFAASAAHAGTIAPQLGMDAGRLSIAASSALTLGTVLTANAAAGGRGAEVDIAGDAIQIASPGQDGRDGYLLLDADGLSALGASSLLIGGKRTNTSEGDQIDVLAGSVLLSNDADHPLQGPEIILVANANGDGITIENGSVLRAKGDIDSATSVPLIIGVTASGTQAAVSGDGALVRVSNGAAAPITRREVTGIDGPAGTAGGALTIAGGALLDGGQVLDLDVTGTAHVAPEATFLGKALNITANRIGLVADTTAAEADGFLIGPNTLAQLTGAVALNSRTSIDFLGNVTLDVPNALTLNAASLHSDGGNVTIAADTLTLGNTTGGIVATPVAGNGILSVAVGELDFSSGNSSLDGIGSFTAVASRGIVTTGQGDFDFGGVDVNLTAPQIVAAINADMTLRTLGRFNLVRGGTAPMVASGTGGQLTVQGGSVDIGADILAPGGNVTLRATNGDLNIGSGARVSVAGLAKPFDDTAAYLPGGSLTLDAQAGNIVLASDTTLDVRGDTAGGNAGQLTVTAEAGNAQLQGQVLGSAGSGYLGGSFMLDTAGAVDLDALSDRLSAGGMNGLISIHTSGGDLALDASHSLIAHTVSLTSDGDDGGHIRIGGTVDASGSFGGDIALDGKWGVDVEGALLTSASAAGHVGGDISISTGGTGDGALNLAYGYEELRAANSGTIHIGASANIDQSGPGGSGSLSLRAPLLVGGSINLVIDSGTNFSHTAGVVIEPYAVWSTTDNSSTDAQHFDGLVDPAGWYNPDGTMVLGDWKDQGGTLLNAPLDADQLAAYLIADYFTPSAPNMAHQSFYGYMNGDPAQGLGTLMSFIQSPGFAFEQSVAGLPSLRVRPGIELRNPDIGVNGGDISVLTNWNLGAGSRDINGNLQLAYRYNGQAPVLSLRAARNLDVRASITDGFFQDGNIVAATATLGTFDEASAEIGIVNNNWGTAFALPDDLGTSLAAQEYYGQFVSYADLLDLGDGIVSGDFSTPPLFGFPVGFYIQLSSPGAGPSPVPAPNIPVNLNQYPQYLLDYKNYFLTIATDLNLNTTFTVPDDFQTIVAPPETLDLIDTRAPVDNSPSPVFNSANPLPILSATLVGGSSTSYRFVAGADFASVNPLAVQSSAAAGQILLDGHVDYRDPTTGRSLHAPSVIRTGTGDIDLASAGDIRWLDDVAPTAIYAAGEPAQGTSVAATAALLQPSQNSDVAGATSELVVTGAVNPDNGGHVSLQSGGDIIGIQNTIDKDGSATGTIDAPTGQYWWQWMQTNNSADRSAIDFGAFDQGVMSVGGNVSVTAAGDIRQLSVSLPTTWVIDTDGTGQQSVRTIGGGDLSVRAGGDILSGSYFVSRGQGSIVAEGRIAADFSRTDAATAAAGPDAAGTEVSTILALQDAQVQVHAGLSIDIGGVYNPSWLDDGGLDSLVSLGHADEQAYSAASSLSVQAVRGDVSYGTLNSPTSLFVGNLTSLVGGVSGSSAGFVLPATVNFTALNGNLNLLAPGELFPSATGNLNLLADGSVRFDRPVGSMFGWGMIDAPASILPSPLHTEALTDSDGDALSTFRSSGYLYTSTGSAYDSLLHTPTALHADDNEPVRLYALNGDIVNGVGGGVEGYFFISPKITRIEAGRDIIDLAFVGQQSHASDLTLIRAGRDILDTSLSISTSYNFFGTFNNDPVLPVIALAGPGNLLIEAGRDIGPLDSQTELNSLQKFQSAPYRTLSDGTGGALTGIDTLGNAYNPYLPSESANIQVLYGVAPGIATADFIAKYIDPAASNSGVSLTADLISFVENYEAGLKLDTGLASDKTEPVLSANEAWDIFNTLPSDVKMLFAQKGLFEILTDVGRDFNDPSSPFAGKYERGYDAINTLFPASLGYTANGLTGGLNGTEKTIDTGDLDIRGSTIQTQQGGNIGILAPGGEALIGSSSAPPVIAGNITAGPNTMGILTLQEGNVDIFTDRSVLLAQSRIFTEQGGDMTIWSSNGDINAGKGAKTTTEIPPATYLCNSDGWCVLNPAGQVSGAGIATLQTIPGAPPGSVFLLAPRGTVDAGDAGIRVSGDLFVAALAVANADNIQVQGKSVGLPPKPVTNLTLTTASTAATEAATIAQNMNQHHDSTISVEVTGFGGESKEPDQCIPNARTACTP